MMNNIIAVLAAFALSGCTVTTFYTYDGKKYDSKESFQQTVDTNVTEVLAGITPLPVPVSKKKLLFAIASASAIKAEITARFIKSDGNQPNDRMREVIDTMSKSSHKEVKVFYDAVQKKNIYSSVQYLEMQSTTASFATSSETDTFYYNLTDLNQVSAQWVYHSSKGDKQLFTYDTSAPSAGGKVKAFVDAVLAQAIRD